jgi:hypothetical protein
MTKTELMTSASSCRAPEIEAGRRWPLRSNANDDLIWGGPALKVALNLKSERQLYYLFSQGRFEDAVWKVGRKTMVGSRAKLQALWGRLAAKSASAA